MLDQVCRGFYIEGDACNLVTDQSKIEKDGKTNNFFQKGGEFQIPQVSTTIPDYE